MQLSEIQHYLSKRQAMQLYRQERLSYPLANGEIALDGKPLINFSGNDYLGLAQDVQVRQAFADAASQLPVGSTGSPLLTGFHPVHQHLAQQLADWLEVDAVLLFSSGFAANQAMLSSLWGADDMLLIDKLAHASMQDLLVSRAAKFRRYQHQDIEQLQQLISDQPAVVIATEGVFSMDGDKTDAAVLLKAANGAPVLFDDAHGLGVFGEQGRGSFASCGVTANQFQCLMGNFGKALGGAGGFLAGSADVIDFIRQQARHYIYSTALPPALCQAMLASIKICRQDEWRREKLRCNIDYFHQQATRNGLNLLPSKSAIQPILCTDADQALRLSKALQQQGIWLSAIRPPTVPQARLRVSLSASHSTVQIDRLLQALQQVFEGIQ